MVVALAGRCYTLPSSIIEQPNLGETELRIADPPRDSEVMKLIVARHAE